MKDIADVKILPQDKIEFTQEQKNLIELAFAKQMPPEDAEFIEKAQKEDKSGEDSFVKLGAYFTKKYGANFGMIYLAAIMG